MPNTFILPRRQQLGLSAVALLALGAAGGAGAMSLTRPGVEMAPTVATPIARLADVGGVVTVRGRVAESYGDRFVVQDGTGRALVATGREGATVKVGSPILVQGRFADGQLRAHFLVDASGQAREIGPGGPHAGRHGPPPPRPGVDGPPPPPPGAGAPPPEAGAPLPPAGVGAPAMGPAADRRGTVARPGPAPAPQPTPGFAQPPR